MEGDGRCFKLFLLYALVVLLLQYFNPCLSLEFNNSGEDVAVKCIKREREALLAFKEGFVVDEPSREVFSSWGREGQKQDCCKWNGVYCSNSTGRVIQLHLGQGYLGTFGLQGKLISSELIELHHLEYLDLSGIDFNRSQIPNFIGSLTNLRYLDLSKASFGGQIPYQLGNLTHLQYLDLTLNEFTNVENLNWLVHLSSLTDLDLSHNNLSIAFDWLEAVNKLPKLTNLNLEYCSLPAPMFSALSNINASKSLANVDLQGNQAITFSIFKWLCNYNASLVYLNLGSTHLTGSIPDVLGNMYSLGNLHLFSNQIEEWNQNSFAKLCSLKSLDLSNNTLSGPFSKFVQVLPTCTQNSLETLDLSENKLSGSLSNLTSFSSLKQLKLDNNQLTGSIPESIGKMSKLEFVSLVQNSLTGVISEIHFSQLNSLWYLDLSYNSLVLNFHSTWIPPFQLEYIKLGTCKMGRHFPKWFQSQTDISYLDISNAGISDSLPSWFWSWIRNVTYMNLSFNQIRGTFANLTLEFAYHPSLHMSSNQIEGPIPSVLSRARHLDLSDNKISGSPSFLCASAVISLSFLNLSSNEISGELPDCWNHLENLIMLDLSNNTLSGKIPTTVGSLYQMETLKLGSNRFVGELPSSLKNCTSLQVIDLGYNKLSGSIPEWLGGSLSNLVILMLQSNNFSGSMPSQLCYLTQIQMLDFSMNNIVGSIPKCFNNLTTLAQKGNSSLNITHTYFSYFVEGSMPVVYEDDATFIWKGIMQVYRNTLGLMKRIDLSSNRLTGEIPSEITHLVGLISLNLSRNQLTGQIPPEIGKLQSLDALDLSRNQIDGGIPTSLTQIDRLSFMDLSYNNLSGKIPTGTQLQSFDPLCYAGNPQLCGPPLVKMCDLEHTTVSNEEDEDELISRGFYISMGFGFVAGFWGVCGSLIFNMSLRYSYFKFLNGLYDWLYVKVALIKRQLNEG